MGFKSTTAYTRLMPIRDIDEHNVVNFFSKDVTGVAGELVKVVTNDLANTDGWSTTTPGASFDGVTNLRYEVKSKIKATEGGENRYSVLGLTLFPTLEVDENGIPLKYDLRRQKELQCVLSGEATPVVTNGIVQLLSSAYTTLGANVPSVNWVGVVSTSGNGLLEMVNPATAAHISASGVGKYNFNQVVGKVIGVQGTGAGDFAKSVMFKLEL